MPEYLAPGVYVEEIPSASKPIQAASTSTAGMVGMTARGPVGTPTLVSSLGAYNRIFGGDLDPLVFTDGRDALPYAVSGFFANGGARLYVVRIVGEDAVESELAIFATDSTVDASPTLAAPAAEGATSIALADVGAATTGTRLLISDGEASEDVTLGAAAPETRLQVDGGLAFSYAAGDAVTPQQAAPVAAVQLDAAAAAGASGLTLTTTVGLAVGTTYLLGGEPELVTIAAINEPVVTLDAPLRSAHASGETLSSLSDGAPIALDSGVDATPARVLIAVDTPAGIDPGDVLKLVNAGGDEELVVVSGIAQVVALAAPLAAGHPENTALSPVVPVLTVHARYPGAWGNSLRVTAGASSLLTTETTSTEAATSQSVEVSTAFGLFPGSVVVIAGRLVRQVATVDTTDGIVTFTTAHGEPLIPGMSLVSREFSLAVDRIEDDRVAESETFDRLSLVPTHPHYALTRVGRWDAASSLPSASGGSSLIRLEDNATAAARLMALVAGVTRPLDGGDDDVAGVGEAAYVGDASEDPGDRTGIQALENEPTVSMVAVPGQTSVNVQQALVDHCERMRYRFAVLDTPIGANLQAARDHRQNFDTTRAAIYYPALEIADRFGSPGERRVIAPAGHLLGVYARTDVARGVHKAPANEVVRGVLSFDQKLDKAVQDILNPLNLNCLRDFRTENRGLRVYGARVATSDPEWRYINVRRLFLFIEQSLDTGLQWAVFEPNSESLWATVKQSVTNFLTTVWRSGALEGTTPEEAFFVNVGYDITMTQDDVDNGRLIVEVGAAPVKPAEFVIVRISQKTREATA